MASASGALGHLATGVAPMQLSAREAKKRAREEQAAPQAQVIHEQKAAQRDADLTTVEGRKAERDRIQDEYNCGLEFARAPPTVAQIKDLLQRSSWYLEAQEGMRLPDGKLNQTAFKRSDPIGALARTDDGDTDLAEAAKKILGVVQSIYDYVIAMTGNPVQVKHGRETSADNIENGREAPPWPKAPPAEPGAAPRPSGYERLKTAITDARDKKEEMYAWASEFVADVEGGPLVQRIPDVQRLLPEGDIVLPPLFVAAPARKSKSVPMLAIVGVLLRMPKVKVAISVAPNKIGPLSELNKKIHQAGWVEAGIAILATTLDNSMSAEEVAAFNLANLFTYSHEEKRDVVQFVDWVAQAKYDGYAVISIHDEADTLTKLLESEEETERSKKKVVELLRPTYSLYNTRTILVGATLLATLPDKSIYGSLLDQDVSDQVADLCSEAIFLPPVEPTDKHIQYIGIDEYHDVEYEEAGQLDEHAFTAINVRKWMRKNRPECLRVQCDSATSWLNTLTKKGPKPMMVKGTLQTAAVAKATFDTRMNAARAAVEFARAKKIGDPYPDDQVSDYVINMPKGNVKLYHDEVQTAILACRTGAFLSQSPLVKAPKVNPDDQEDHWVSKMLVVSCTPQQQATGRDVSGGLAGYTRLVLDQAIEQEQPCAVLLYSSASCKSLSETTNTWLDPYSDPGGKNPVKLFLALPAPSRMVVGDDDDDDGAGTGGGGEDDGVTWARSNFSCHSDAASALAKAHEVFEEYECGHLIAQMRVVDVGYDMFRAATTLSVSNLTIDRGAPAAPGAAHPNAPKRERVHYLPKSMILCHTATKQLNVLYQMLGRGMNLLLAIFMRHYKIDVLSHAKTLRYVKCYYLLERYVVKCMHGVRDSSSRLPDKMMGMLVGYARTQTEAMGVDSTVFLQNQRIGLTRKSIAQTLVGGKEANGGELVMPSDIIKPEHGSDDDDPYADESSDDDEAESGDGAHEFAKDIMGWKSDIGKPEASWNLRPHYKQEDSTNPASFVHFMKQCTQGEKDACYRSAGKKKSGEKTERNCTFYQPKYLDAYPDLVKRVLPTWFVLLWKLYVHHQWHNNDLCTADRIANAKSTAQKSWLRVKGALSYLICTQQFVPEVVPEGDGCDKNVKVNMWSQLGSFALDLGGTPDMRREVLNHMLRALKWNTSNSDNHANHVTQLTWLLEAIIECNKIPEGSSGDPWNLPQLGKMQPWFKGNLKEIVGGTKDDDDEVCTYEKVDLEGPDAYLTLVVQKPKGFRRPA